ncbi:MAG: mechanosensitive ion channel family protein [Candidatus Micrarchaeota archaeon]
MVFSIALPFTDALSALPGGLLTAAVIIFVVLSLLFQFVMMLILKIASMLVGHTQTTLDDRILKAVSSYLPAIATVTALMIALQATDPDLKLGQYAELDVYLVLMLAIAGFLLSSVADAVLVWYGLEIHADKKKIKENEVFPFVRNVVKVFIILISLVFVFQKLGFETGAIITGLGVGGLAVALALQDTLGNFFAGLHILIDKPFREEDFVKLENGLEGTVKQIGWRTTRLITQNMNEVIVPNSKLANSILENYSTPQEMSGVSYVVGVDCKEDIDSVEKVIAESLRAVAKRGQMIEDQTIWVRFDSFGDYSLNFKFGYMVKGYIHRFAVIKEVNRELFYAFKKHDVSIPFPVRVVYRQDEGKKR